MGENDDEKKPKLPDMKSVPSPEDVARIRAAAAHARVFDAGTPTPNGGVMCAELRVTYGEVELSSGEAKFVIAVNAVADNAVLLLLHPSAAEVFAFDMLRILDAWAKRQVLVIPPARPVLVIPPAEPEPK